MGEAVKKVEAADETRPGNHCSGSFQPIIRERSRAEREGEIAMRLLSVNALFAGDNLNRSEKARILRDLPPGQGGALWRAYVAQWRATDAEREGDWLALARSVEEAEEWRRVAEMWAGVEPEPGAENG